MTATQAAARLVAALAERYRIERELGQGGMATVYLAEDLKHRRKVAVKVLRPDLVQSLGAARFLREIEIAAQLAHPHILPLHDSGEADGFLYYVMPFVEGESLRQRLAREGALPPADAARFLREIADALGYAHAHNVVHRDIKPENVMLAGRHALVMDFGVARAISEAAGEGLTTVGVTLGTPSYMAPEQAVAAPDIDHRADIYALGVIGYEMLVGKTPFAGMSPQQALAAHITRVPDPLPVAVNGQPVLPALAALVMQCLEKQAADRPQSAADLVPLLEVTATPSGGAEPAVTRPVISSATQAAIRRGHPARVALLFAAGSALVMGIVAFLVYRLGLPDWVLWAAALLLLIGLPIMVITGRHERRRALARTTAAIAPAEPGPTSWFTWRRALAGGGLAFGALAMVAAGYTAMRVLGIGPVGTLVASGALAERDRMILADFENRTADSTLGGSLTEALRVDLSQSPSVRLVDAAEVADALARMQRPPGTRVTADIAREVAERSGVKAIVAGQIDPVGSGYVLSANLLSAAEGRSLAAVRETADDAGHLLGAIDRLSARLRERIGESLVTIRSGQPLQRVTTASLAALRKYSEGVRLVDLGRAEEAIPVLREAIALDSGFAMAYRKLAVAIGNFSGPFSSSAEIAAATRAYELRDRLPEVERELATAYYFDVAEYDPGRSEAAYRAVLSRDPDEGTALNNLAQWMNLSRRFAAAESLAAHAITTGATASYFFHVLNAQVAQGKLDAARLTVTRAAADLPPGSPTGPELAGLLALATRDYTTGEQAYRQLRREHPSSYEQQFRSIRALTAIAETRGFVREAVELSRARMATAEAAGLPRDYITEAARLSELELRYRARPAEALGIVQTALARYRLDSLAPADRPYLELARANAAAGRADAARRLLREYESLVPESVRRGDIRRNLVYGRVLEAEGRYAEAAERYRAAYQADGFCGSCGLFEMAQLYDRQGQPDSARAIYQRLHETPTSIGRIAVESHALAATYKRLGELYEAQGDRAKAADYYGRFVELWKDADPELQPGVREVRQRLARLAQEPGA